MPSVPSNLCTFPKLPANQPTGKPPEPKEEAWIFESLGISVNIKASQRCTHLYICLIQKPGQIFSYRSLFKGFGGAAIYPTGERTVLPDWSTEGFAEGPFVSPGPTGSRTAIFEWKMFVFPSSPGRPASLWNLGSSWPQPCQIWGLHAPSGTRRNPVNNGFRKLT